MIMIKSIFSLLNVGIILVEGYLKLNIWSDENNKTHKNILIVAKRIEYLDFPKKMNNLESVYVDEHPTF